MKKSEFKNLLLIVLIGITFYISLEHIDIIIAYVSKTFKLFSPFILGLVIAFVLNVPVSLIEKYLKEGKDKIKHLRSFSITISIICFILVLLFVGFLVIPSIINTIKLFVEQLPDFIVNSKNYLTKISEKIPELHEYITNLEISETILQDKITTLIKTSWPNILNSSFTIIINFFSGVMNFVIAFIFAIYILAKKEVLNNQLKKILYAYGNKKKIDRFYEIMSLSHITFTKFITGQCLECLILGLMFFIGMIIFQFPYALSISVLAMITALIPVFGAFIAAIIGALLIFITNPIQAFWFIIFFLIIQQIEGNFIYPKVVGKSVSLPAMWVILAVTVGGGLFGITGMIISVPLSSIIYALVKESTHRRLKVRKIKI